MIALSNKMTARPSTISSKKVDRYWDEFLFKQKYLYDVAYNREFDFANAVDFFEKNRITTAGACTAIRNGNLLGRNLDWLYANDCVFVIHAHQTNRRYASLGTASCLKITEEFVESGEWSEKYKVLPYCTMDGVNEHGVWATSLVVPSDFDVTNQNTGKQRACLVMLVRMLLDGAKNVNECETIINNYDWFSSSKGELHFLFGDSTQTRLLEFINGATTITTPVANILTNFHKHNTSYGTNGHIDWDTVEDHGMGLERHDLAVDGVSTAISSDTMMDLMRSLNYTKTYSKNFADADFWLTEYCSNTQKYGDLTLRTPKNSFETIVADMQALYALGQRDGSYWQSVTNCVYDIDAKKLYLLIDEEAKGNLKEFSLNESSDIDVSQFVKKSGDESITGNKEFTRISEKFIDLGAVKNDMVLNADDGAVYQIDLYGDIKITPSSSKTGAKKITAIILGGQDFTVTFDSSIIWKDDTVPKPDGIDELTLYTVDNITWYGSMVNYKKLPSRYCIGFTSDSSISLSMSGSYNNGSLEYSLDGRTNWKAWNKAAISGKTLYLRGTNNTKFASNLAEYNQFKITSSSDVYCNGNIENLLDYSTVRNGEHPQMDNFAFVSLFFDCAKLKTPPSLPATTISEYCYAQMFYNAGIEQAPELPSKKAPKNCYQSMFYNTLIKQAPDLPATELGDNCCSMMFSKCSLLEQPPVLSAMVLSKYCYQYMFQDCIAMKQPPVLPATTLADGCYGYMFSGCSELEEPPALPATELFQYCYYYMFSNCKKMKRAPILPATTLANGCYQYMLINCEAIEEPPVLPSMVMASWCYQYMFYGCKKMKQPPVLPATTLAEACYGSMFDSSGIEEPPALPLTSLANNCYQNMFRNCKAIKKLPALPANALTQACYNTMFDGCTEIKISTTQTAECPNEYRIPTEGEGITASNSLLNMFANTGGTFKGTPSINTTYYTNAEIVS